MKEYTFDNIQEFYDKMDKSVNSKMLKMRVYGSYIEVLKKREKEKTITKVYDRPGCAHFAHLISEDIAIVEQVKGTETQGYFAHVNNKPSHYIWETFDEALLCALSIKHTGNEQATDYLKKLLK